MTSGRMNGTMLFRSAVAGLPPMIATSRRRNGSTTVAAKRTPKRIVGNETTINVIRQVSRPRSEEHTSELQSLMRISYAVFCLQKKKQTKPTNTNQHKNHI